MAKYLTISVQGINKELTTANGNYDPVNFEKLSEDKAIELIEKLSQIKDNLDYSSGDFCPPGFTIKFGKEDVESFFIENNIIKYTETGKEVSAEDVLKIARKEVQFDKREIRAEKFASDGVFPIRKRHILPTDTDNIEEEKIETTEKSPQFEHTVWRSRGWLEASHTAPFAIGGFFALVGIVVLGEKRDAEMAPIFFLIAVICFLTFFPWRTLAKTKIKCGIDWSSNTLWVKRKKTVVGFQPDANYIEEIVSLKSDSIKSNPLWLVEPSTPILFRKKQWFLQTKHLNSEHLWMFNGAVFSTKKEVIAVAEKFNRLLKSQM